VGSRRRRATDFPPLSEIVTKGNLDDRLETVKTWMDDHEKLAAERWNSHRAVHDQVAESLRDYKKDANEWRATLTDLRTTFIPKAEYLAEHRGLEGKILALLATQESRISALDSRLDSVESSIQTINDREATTRGVLSSGRNVIALAFTVLGSLIALALYLNPHA
jgi:hypothetical protein